MLLAFFVLTFLLSLVALGISSGIVANALLGISRVVGINEYFISFIFIGVATSIPELFVAIAASIVGVPMISIGNVLGANFVNLTLVLGIVTLLSNGIELQVEVPKKIFWISFVLSLLPLFLISNGGITRLGGLILCLVFLAYTALFFINSSLIEKSIRHLPYGVHVFSDIYCNFRNLFIGLIFLILSAVFIVFFSSSLANYLSLEPVYFGIVFLGIITTLPELIFGIKSALLRHPALAIGNLLASVVLNSTLIPGVLSLFYPTATTISSSTLLSGGILTFVAFVLISIFAYSGSRISKSEGLLLILLYVLFLVAILII